MNSRSQPRLRLGRRDKFWLLMVLVVLIILAVFRLESPGGFSGPGKAVWKSGVLGGEPVPDTVGPSRTDTLALKHAHVFPMKAR